jgi:hypothetical protein
MRSPRWLSISTILFLAIAGQSFASAAPGPATSEPTRVVVLGVNHAVQLVSEDDQPGMLAAFIEKVSPSAICIERAPEPYARGDHYEFTYEIQDIVLPYARKHGIEICPFDWEPSIEDQMLGWGMDISVPPEVRSMEGFQGFLLFREPRMLRRGLFEADDPKSLTEVHDWIRNPPERASRDLPRRMYLYRTFMQARGIAAAARQQRGRTLLVVVGEYHKQDIEQILADDKSILLVQPSSFGLPARDDAERLTGREHRIAIASFNLLGVQADTGNVDMDWVGRVLDALERERKDPETALLRTRYEVLKRQIDPATAIERYQGIASDPGARAMPTWNGVLDRSRVDSYFDPFGNLRIDQRARVEIARERYRRGEVQPAGAALSVLQGELTERQARQLAAYWHRDLAATSSKESGKTP